ncbi:50S ribosomal protein L2 [candidate division WWE3 bacterium]|uniref:Large ribosomal subunit protein uL2 n=1 Tax=candidate division WWE3 bacterium TaxID=2053526 RepID=A0A955RR41_UNCKA|nr:50S ribosomal protein L2 [candidate division WWE3 bacterium]
MKIKRHKPTSPGQRSRVTVNNKHLSKKRPVKKLTVTLTKHAGRSRGTISVRHQGGGHKRLYRIIDFKRSDKTGVAAEVIALEYDPNRSANIALLKYEDGEVRYILAPKGLMVGASVMSGSSAKIETGNALPLGDIPVGMEVHNVEMSPGQGGKVVRSAGQSARVMAIDEGWVHVKLPSGEVRKFDARCYATIGAVGNSEHAQRVLGKAGASRHLGKRPQVRGTAMAAGDHKHGGGEGRTGTGRVPRTVYGKAAYGKRTRKKNKKSNRYVVKSRRDK